MDYVTQLHNPPKGSEIVCLDDELLRKTFKINKNNTVQFLYHRVESEIQLQIHTNKFDPKTIIKHFVPSVNHYMNVDIQLTSNFLVIDGMKNLKFVIPKNNVKPISRDPSSFEATSYQGGDITNIDICLFLFQYLQSHNQIDVAYIFKYIDTTENPND